jgi:hypothetical protein
MMVINQAKDPGQGSKLYESICRTANKSVNANEGRFTIRPEYLGAIPYARKPFGKWKNGESRC